MRGRVLAFFISDNVGYISGDDGKRYTFIGQEWKEQHAPQKGDYVDFDIDVSENATRIFFLSAISSSCNILSVEDQEKHRERLLIEKNYTMKDWWNKCLKNYTTISGRARRAELWSFCLCQFGILFALFVVSMIAMVLASSSSAAFFSIFTVIALIAFFIVYVALLLPTITVGGRRLHDISMSAWWLLLYFVPCGGFILLICFCINTDPKENQWGLPAK